MDKSTDDADTPDVSAKALNLQLAIVPPPTAETDATLIFPETSIPQSKQSSSAQPSFSDIMSSISQLANQF